MNKKYYRALNQRRMPVFVPPVFKVYWCYLIRGRHAYKMGTLQLLAATCADAVRRHAHCRLRTPSGNAPSDFISRTALANLLHANIRGLGKNPVTQFILRKQTPTQATRERLIALKRRAA